MIRRKELVAEIKSLGAKKTAENICAALKKGELTYKDMPPIRDLYECFWVEKANDKHSVGSQLLSEEHLTEEAATYSDGSAFANVTGQFFFNAVTTRYMAADFTVSPLFREIPSTLFRGEKFAGISNINQVLTPTLPGRDLPVLAPTEDYTEGPAQRHIGALVDLTIELVRGDRTGEIMEMAGKLGECIGVNDELEAVGTLMDVNSTRTEHKWKGTTYATYQSSTPWVNTVTSNPIVSIANLNAAYVALQNILDPFTGLPTTLPPGRLKLVVTPDYALIAQRLMRGTQYRTGTASSSNEITISDFPPFEADIVVSKYLGYLCDQNSLPRSTWYLGIMDAAFSWQVGMPLTVSEAVPNAGDLFRKSLAASYKAERYKTSFAFNPRFVIKNTA